MQKLLTSAAAGEGQYLDEFSELEMDRYDDFNILSRSMTEISADVNEVLTQLENYINRVEGDIDEFTKPATTCRTKSPPRACTHRHALFPFIPRNADAAKSSQKVVDLDFSGSETELDNNIIQQISDPLVHLVRNSVAHGIELPNVRAVQGKPEQGKVSLRATIAATISTSKSKTMDAVLTTSV